MKVQAGVVAHRLGLTNLMDKKLDVSASYPNGGVCFNISRDTTRRELIQIEGVSEQMQRMQGINLSSGATNALEVCQHLFGMPSLEELGALWEEEFNVIELQAA